MKHKTTTRTWNIRVSLKIMKIMCFDRVIEASQRHDNEMLLKKKSFVRVFGSWRFNNGFLMNPRIVNLSRKKFIIEI